jgi:hypothetical protein
VLAQSRIDRREWHDSTTDGVDELLLLQTDSSSNLSGAAQRVHRRPPGRGETTTCRRSAAGDVAVAVAVAVAAAVDAVAL